MIITIRNQFKQSTFRYIAMLVVVAMVVGMISIPSLMKHESGNDRWAMKVNGQKVSYRDFAQELAEQNEFLAQIRAQYGQYADFLLQAMNWPTDPKALASEILIKLALMNQLVSQLGIYIGSEYIAESIHDAQFARRHLQRIIPPALYDASGALNTETLKMYLKHKGISVREFENKVESSIAQLQAMQFVASSAYTPSFTVEQAFIAQKLGKEFSYLAFSFDSFIAAEKRNGVSDEDALAFYTKENSLARRYWVPEKRDAMVWKFNAKSYNASVSEEHINQYYEDNKVSKYILEPIKIHVQQISEKQLAQYPDMTLEMVKEELENDPHSIWAKKWESIEPFARGEKKGDFEKEAFLLQNPGDISHIIDTQNGKVIIQLIKRIPRTYKPLSAVKNEIKNLLMEKQFKKNFVKDLKAVAIKGDAQALESLIAQKGGKKELAMGIIKNDTKLSQELFSLKKGEYGFFVDNDSGVAVWLTKIVDRHLPEFETIKDIVKEDVCEERARQAMMDALQEAKEAAVDTPFEVLAKEFNASLQHTGLIRPDDAKKMQELDKKGFPGRTMVNLDKEGLIMVHHGEGTSYLIKVDALEDYSQEDVQQAQNELKVRLEPHRMKAQVESFVASLHRNATIETNESMVTLGEEYSE